MFEKNVGTVDQAVRIVAGLALLSLVFVGPKTLWGLVGLVPIGTAFVRFCPAYTLFSFSTRRATPPGSHPNE